jgi:hypothetical protein
MSDATNLADAKAAHYENADYEETGDATKARAFVTACRRLIGLLPARMTKGGREVGESEFDLQRLEQQLAAARLWLSTQASAAVSGSSLVRYMER